MDICLKKSLHFRKVMHQSFVSIAPPSTGNSGDDNFSSTTALLKVLHCGDLLRVTAPLFILVNLMGVYLRNITSPALTRHCEGTQNVTVPHISPTIPHPSPTRMRRVLKVDFRSTFYETSCTNLGHIVFYTCNWKISYKSCSLFFLALLFNQFF